jgi:hypothetical protein
MKYLYLIKNPRLMIFGNSHPKPVIQAVTDEYCEKDISSCNALIPRFNIHLVEGRRLELSTKIYFIKILTMRDIPLI